MSDQRCSPDHPVAILSFHSHGDRSFLDDRELALLSGELRDEGANNDLILVVLTPEMQADMAVGETESQLVRVLDGYNPIVFERVWSPHVIRRLRRRLPRKTFIALRGEHEMLEDSPADMFCTGNARTNLLPLIRWLRGQVDVAPADVLVRSGGRWRRPAAVQDVEARGKRYVPNLRPRIINPDLLPEVRTFSVTGNTGCPYQSDARENELYRGAEIPSRFGRGCAFCTTGNHYEARPNAETARSVLEQIRYVRQHAPELELLVLKDQNPFGYLTEVVERLAVEGLSDFSILLETRAEWFLRNAQRFVRALQVAGTINVRLAPFLIGIESFSQAELDRFNKGISAELNVEFLETLWQWKEKFGDALDLSHAAFGFILFSPWTTMQDLEINWAGIRRTHLDRLRGSILLSRARLYPDTALYYLAKRDGLLVDHFASDAEDASLRYGYYPSHPWKHLHQEVAHFAELATLLAERNGSRDMVNLLRALLDVFAAAGDQWSTVGCEDVWQHYLRDFGGGGQSSVSLVPADKSFRQRFAQLIQPLPLEGTFAGGWSVSELRVGRGRVEVGIRHDHEADLLVDLVPRGKGPYYRQSRHYDLSARGSNLSAAQSRVLTLLAEAICRNDS